MKHAAHSHQYRQHRKWETHAACSICGFAVSKSDILKNSSVSDRQLSAELLNERTALKTNARTP
jgi:hypothetical protein